MGRRSSKVRRIARRARRRSHVIVRSVLLHVVVLALLMLALLARMEESSREQLALGAHAPAAPALDGQPLRLEPTPSHGLMATPPLELAALARGEATQLPHVGAARPRLRAE